MTPVTSEKRDRLIYLLLRIGVAIAFIYPAVSAWFNPFAWVGYLPSLMLDFAGTNDMLLLHVFGVFEIIIGLWILSGEKIFIPSVVATLLLAAIVIVHFRQMDVIFRDIPIALMSLALALKYKPQQSH